VATARLFRLDNGRVRLADAVFVYLERTLAPNAPLPPEVAPRSYGLSPCAVSPAGSVIAACALGEAVWLGFQAVDVTSPVFMRVRVESSEAVDAVTGERWEERLREHPRNHLICPPDSWLVGVRRGTGFVPFGVDNNFTVLCYGERVSSVRVELVSPATFTAVTGLLPEPLDPDSAYKGWRLP
jgi:hypothetical protein